MGMMMRRCAPGRMAGSVPVGWWWHLLHPLALQLSQSFQFTVIQKDAATVVALFDVDAVAIVSPHGASALRTLHGHGHERSPSLKFHDTLTAFHQRPFRLMQGFLG